MASRKQTPDVLGDLLGGGEQAPQPAPTPKPKPATRPEPSRRGSRRRTKAAPPGWEYMEIVFRDYRGYRPRYVNGEEQSGWKESPVIHMYLNQLGEDGWELAGVGSRHNGEMPAYFKRRKG